MARSVPLSKEISLLKLEQKMIRTKSLRRLSITSAVCASSLLALVAANASDHQEAPGATSRLSADIGDYYAWHDSEQLNLVLTFGTFAAPGLPASYDRDNLYGFHFDTSSPADGVADVDLYARFSQDAEGNWGLQLSGIDGVALEGPVETVLSNAQITGWAGLADDPFFFDQTGFRATLSTGMLSFDPTRDDVAGLNVTAIAIQIPVDTIMSGGGSLQTWTTTSTL